MLFKAVELFLVHLIIPQLNPHTGKPLLPRIDGRINLPLRPVLGGLFPGEDLRRKGGGFDFIHCDDAVCGGVNAIRPAFQRILYTPDGVLLPQKDFGGVIRMLPDGGALQFAVQPCALIGPVKAGRTAVNAAGQQQKFHQPTYRQSYGTFHL